VNNQPVADSSSNEDEFDDDLSPAGGYSSALRERNYRRRVGVGVSGGEECRGGKAERTGRGSG